MSSCANDGYHGSEDKYMKQPTNQITLREIYSRVQIFNASLRNCMFDRKLLFSTRGSQNFKNSSKIAGVLFQKTKKTSANRKYTTGSLGVLKIELKSSVCSYSTFVMKTFKKLWVIAVPIAYLLVRCYNIFLNLIITGVITKCIRESLMEKFCLCCSQKQCNLP